MKPHTSLIASLLLCAAHGPVQAWGGTGHRIIGELAMTHLPASLPAFLRTPKAAAQVGLMAQEPDISRNAGNPHDADRDPGHFLDASDDGTILGGPRLDALPPTRRDYDTALRAVGTDQYKAGFLPYAMIDGWQQLVKDFALLRRDMAAVKFAGQFSMTAAQRKGFNDQLALRRMLTLRDLGVWAHFVGDASQPMHVTVHYNGWGDGPNPDGYVTGPGLHAKFESAFVDANIRAADVAALLRPYRPTGDIQTHTQGYLTATAALVPATYALDKAGAFDMPTPQSKAFVAARLAEGAAQLRDMVTDAWAAAGAATVGYHQKASVADLEAGKADPRGLD